MSEARIDRLDDNLRDVDRRVAVLEQIPRDTATALSEMRADIRQMRDDFRWLLRVVVGGCIAVLGVLGHVAHWF
jgi:hypothetical protein